MIKWWGILLLMFCVGCGVTKGPVRVDSIDVWKEPHSPNKFSSVEWSITLEIELQKDPVKPLPELDKKEVDDFNRGFDDAMSIRDEIGKGMIWPAQ